MYYRTRHLEALKEVDHEGLRKPGERFYATEIDAEYLKKHGRAKDVVEAAPAPKVEVAPAPSAARTTTRAKPASNPEPAAAPGAESLVMTTRDVPGPGQDSAESAGASKTSPVA